MRIKALLTSLLLMSAPAMAQEDPNLRHPEVYSPSEGSYYVVGQNAFGNALSEVVSMRGMPDDQNQELITTIVAGRNVSPPIFLFEAARRAAPTNPDMALEIFFLARARTTYDALRCVDSSALGVVEAASSLAGEEIITLMTEDINRMLEALERVYDSGAIFAGTTSPWWACSFGNSAFYAAANNAPMTGDEWLKFETRWPEAQESILLNLRSTIDTLRESQESSAN
jgi:hypothetical protein